MTSMNQEEALVYLMKPSRNSTANRNIACACGVHKHFAVPIGPTSGAGQQGEAPGGSFARLLPLHGSCMELPLLHPPPATQLSHFPRVKRRKQKACIRKRGLASTAACSTVLRWPPHSTSTGGVTAHTAPWQRCRASPRARMCASLSCPAAVAYKMSA